MSLETQVMDQLKQAMKSKDEVALRTLRSIKAALLEEKTSVSSKAVLTEADEMKILQKMAKQRKDSLEIFKNQNRPDLAQKEEEELNILKRFLPEQLSHDELREMLKDIISQTGAKSPADMGKIMGIASKSLAGKADGAQIAAVVKELLKP